MTQERREFLALWGRKLRRPLLLGGHFCMTDSEIYEYMEIDHKRYDDYDWIHIGDFWNSTCDSEGRLSMACRCNNCVSPTQFLDDGHPLSSMKFREVVLRKVSIIRVTTKISKLFDMLIGQCKNCMNVYWGYSKIEILQ
jgi:hypothetical protein